MLNLNCVICAELFTQTDDVHVTKCGHLFHYACLCQWLERSKTCPQCRNRCTDANVHRVYFNLANLDTSAIDVGSLQEQLDNANLKAKVNEKNVRHAEEQIKNLKLTQKKCMKTISALEQKVQKNDFIILSYTEQLKMAREEAKEADELRKEVKRLKEKIEMMENVSSILSSTTQDAEKLLKTEKNPTTLAVWVSALKRELRTCESKKTDLRNVLKVVQSDLRKETELRKKREEHLSQLESDNYNLTQRLTQLEREKEKEKLNNADMLDSPSTSLNDTSRVRMLNQEAKQLTLSPNTVKQVRKIEESNSPYFNIKASGVPLNMLKIATLRSQSTENKEQSAQNELSERFSIFKKSRLSINPSTLTSSLKPGFIYDSFGGTMRAPIEIDDDDRDRGKIVTKKSSTHSLSSRLKAGKLRKFPSAGTESMEKFLTKS